MNNIRLKKISENEYHEVGEVSTPWTKGFISFRFKVTNLTISKTFNYDTNLKVKSSYTTISGKATINQTIYLGNEGDDGVVSLKLIHHPYDTIDCHITESSGGISSELIYGNDYKLIKIGLTEDKINSITESLQDSVIPHLNIELDFPESYYMRYSETLDEVYLREEQGILKSIDVVSNLNSENEYMKNINKSINKIKKELDNHSEEIKKEFLEANYINNSQHITELKQMQSNQGITIIATILIIGTIIACNYFY